MHPRIPFLLRSKLTVDELKMLPHSYDMIGDIVIFAEFPKLGRVKERMIGDALLKTHTHVKVVCKKVGKFGGEFRKPKLAIIAGQRRKTTVHKENGVMLGLHVENTYFSPRLATERQRIVNLVKNGENVLVMFSGVGPYSIEIGKNTSAKLVVGVEKNPEAHTFALENVKRNKVEDVVECRKGDVKRIVPHLKDRFNRIIMPLPKDAPDFLGIALSRAGKPCMLHVYLFVKEGEEEAAARELEEIIARNDRNPGLVKWFHCGQFGPGIFRTCFDVKVY